MTVEHMVSAALPNARLRIGAAHVA